MIFDVLDNLEWYQNQYPSVARLIDIMDRSIPYENTDGTYCVDGIEYTVSSYVSRSDGPIEEALFDCMHIVLEGEEMIALEEEGIPSVVALAIPGRFVLLEKGEHYKSSLQKGVPQQVKKVIFTLAGPRL